MTTAAGEAYPARPPEATVDLTASDIGGDLPDVSSLALGEVLISDDTVLAACLARMARELASGNELIAAGFQSSIHRAEEEDDRHGAASAVRAQGGEPL
jgi:FXSXX-COOH protein